MEFFDLEVWKQALSEFGISSQTLLYGMLLFTTMLLTFTLGFLFVGTRSPLDKKLKQISGDNHTSGRKSYDFTNTLESLTPFIDAEPRKTTRLTQKNSCMRVTMKKVHFLSFTPSKCFPL